MKAAVTDGRGRVWLEDVPVPEPDEHQCLCRMLACASCTGTDLKHIHDKLPWEQTYPGLLGHESIGEVIEVGDRVTAFSKGDWVLRPTPVYPGSTHAGYSSMWGGFAEYGLVTDVAALKTDQPEAVPNNYARFQLPVPRDLGVSPADWTMIITLKETAGFAASLGVTVNTALAVLGAGSVGIAMMRFAKVFGATPLIAVARRDEQLDYAVGTVGADAAVNSETEDPAVRLRELNGGDGLDLIIDTSGSIDLTVRCVPALGPGGRVAGYATYPRRDPLAEHVPAESFVAGRTGEDTCHDYMIDAVRLGLVNLRDMYSDTMPFSQIAEGFARLERKEAMKIVFEMEG